MSCNKNLFPNSYSWIRGFQRGGANLKVHLDSKNVFFFFINFIRILWFFWDMKIGLFDQRKTFFLGKFFLLQGVNCAKKWNKTVNFGYVPFLPKCKSLKDISNTVFALQKSTPALSFSKIEQYLVITGLKTLLFESFS